MCPKEKVLKVKVLVDSTLKCPLCKVLFGTPDALKIHFRECHLSLDEKADLKQMQLLDKSIWNARHRRKFKIFSLRGSRIYKSFSCDLCGMYTTSGWYYKESSRGEVNICHICKDKNRPTRPPYKSILKNAVESNKNKH